MTSTGSGLSVPDWPLSFGTFFPQMKGGVLFEHGHRLIAGTVVILTCILVYLLVRFEPRRWVKNLGFAAVSAILFQALLGGLTVLLRLPPIVSILHASVAQLFFCAVATIAVVTSPTWLGSPNRKIDPIRGSVPILTVILVYAQIILGAVMRHIGAGLAIPDFPMAFHHWIPPASFFSVPVAVHYAHRVGALAVAIFVIWNAALTVRYFPVPAILSVILLVFQITLGAFIIWTAKAALPTTLHVVTGAAILGTELTLALYTWRFSKTGDAG